MRSHISLIAILVLTAVSMNIAQAEWGTSTPVAELNSNIADDQPFLSHDGRTMYLSRYQPGVNAHQMYQATRDNISQPFGSVTEISTFNIRNCHIMFPWVSSDNLRMYYHITQNGTRKVRVANRASTSAPWTPGIELPEINAYGDILSISLSSDECTAFFTNYLTWQTYMATRPNRFSAFDNIAPMTTMNVNGSAAPCMTPDELTVYFVSGYTGTNQLYKVSRTTKTNAFGDAVMVPGFDGIHSLTLNSDATIMYWSKAYYSQSTFVTSDIFVSHYNTAPVANAGPDQCVYASINNIAEVTLDGSASNDSQDNTLTYAWSYTLDGMIYEVNGVNPKLELPAGIHNITLIVSDGEYDSQPDDVTIEVVAPLNVKMKFEPVVHVKPYERLDAKFVFPSDLNEQVEPYSFALAADPSIKADYFDICVDHGRIVGCNIGFDIQKLNSQTAKSSERITIMGTFKSGRVFYGEDTVKIIPFRKN